MKVNVYDFDKTILPYDSSVEFFKFCVRRHPRCALRAIPAVAKLPLYPLKKTTRTAMKETWFRYLTMIPDIDAEVALFWEQNFGNIHPWYLERRRPDDIINSASPEFLLKPVAEKLGVRLIASKVGKYTGLYEGANNDGAEKVWRLNHEYPGLEIGDFFSDSLHDSPLAEIAERAYLVAGGKILPWPNK